MVEIGSIDKNIPIPKPKRAKLFDYGLSDLKVGDSVLVVGTEEEIKSVRGSAYRLAKIKRWKIASRSEGEGGMRLWRTE